MFQKYSIDIFRWEEHRNAFMMQKGKNFSMKYEPYLLYL